MDTFTIIVMLLIAFLAWNMNMMWLFYAIVGIVMVTAKSWAIAIVLLVGVAALYFLKLEQYFLIFFIIIVGLVLIISEKRGGGKSESYSPELMRLLGGM